MVYRAWLLTKWVLNSPRGFESHSFLQNKTPMDKFEEEYRDVYTDMMGSFNNIYDRMGMELYDVYDAEEENHKYLGTISHIHGKNLEGLDEGQAIKYHEDMVSEWMEKENPPVLSLKEFKRWVNNS